VAYRVEIAPRAERDLRALPREEQERIRPRIDALGANPRPPGAEKLAGAENLYRLRVGAYRVLYQVADRILLVLVLEVGHRREVYRRLKRLKRRGKGKP
jgi:mRNA interferase RelE/StbE